MIDAYRLTCTEDRYIKHGGNQDVKFHRNYLQLEEDTTHEHHVHKRCWGAWLWRGSIPYLYDIYVHYFSILSILSLLMVFIHSTQVSTYLWNVSTKEVDILCR